ncbi:MAG: phospholipase D-like domain-containing protein [Trebonia sp.]
MAVLAVSIAVAGCSGGSGTGPGTGAAATVAAAATGKAPHSAAPAKAAPGKTASGTGTGVGSLRLLVEPGAGVGGIYQLIRGARTTIDLTMYELNDLTGEDDLAAAAARGVNVRVILDRHLEKSRNEAAYSFLSSHGVHVTWAPAGTTYHQKTLTVDGTTSAVMTLNMVTSDYPDTRDFYVIDEKPADVTAIVATFNADFAGTGVTPANGADLVWSPTNSQDSILGVINSATHTLAVENEEMGFAPVTAALENAARRGVNVEVVMTADSEWDDAFAQLTAAGVHVRTFRDSSSEPYIHAKAVVADAGRSDQRVFVGSENFSTASLDYNRELGILTKDKSVVAGIASTIATDYADSAPYEAPAAVAPTSAAAATGSLCGAPANPLGLTLCRGGQLVDTPPSGVCSYFNCIASFADGKGYMEECADGTYSMSGGREGVCTDHGGPSKPVYQG